MPGEPIPLTHLTHKCAAIRRLRRIVRDESQQPLVRLDAAFELVERFGVSERNLSTLTTRIKFFLLSSDSQVSERASEVRDLMILKLDERPVVRTIRSLNHPADDEPSPRSKPRPSGPRFPQRALVFPKTPDDGYVPGSIDLAPYISRLRAATFKTGDWLAQIRAALGVENEPIDPATITTIFLACMHDWSSDVSDLLTAVIGYGNATHVSWPRVSGLTIMEELERLS